jgi:hypothetical protein
MKKRQALKIRKQRLLQDSLIYKPTTNHSSWVVFNRLSRSKRQELWTKWLGLNKNVLTIVNQKV